MLNEFLTRLNEELTVRHIEDREGIMDFIQEMINDHLDNGEKLEDVLKALGDPADIARSFADDDVPETEERSIVQTQSSRLEYDYLKDLDIENVSYNYEILPSAEDKVVLEYDESDESYLNIRYHDGRLSIEQEWNYDLKNIFRKRKIVVNAGTQNVRIYIPEGNEPDIDLENVSGKIDISDLTFRKMELEGVSGLMTLSNISCHSLECENVSGAIVIENVEADRYCTMETVSGRIEGNVVASGKISAESVSGSIGMKVNGDMQDYDIEVSSLFNSKKTRGNGHSVLTIETVSGKVSYEFV